VKQTFVGTNLQGQNVHLQAGNGMNVQTTGSPQMGALNAMGTSPIRYQTVGLTNQNWDESHSGLSVGASTLLALSTAAWMGGAGASLFGTQAAVTTAMANAGVAAFAAQGAVALVNNGGNLGKTFQDLGSEQILKNTVAATVAGGVTGGFSDYSVTRLAAQTATGCAAGSITGGGCEQGAKAAAVTAAAAWTYNHFVGYDAKAGPGKNPEKPFYDYDRNTGQQEPQSRGNNVTGNNKPGYFCSQGTNCSKILNELPLINGTAGFHDWIFNKGLLPQTDFNNIWTMPASAILGIPASLNQADMQWLLYSPLPKKEQK
jgi:hypothetical protein